jgi:putative hemolysin
LPERVIEIDLDLEEDDLKRGRLALPPLIKGYLWLGGFVGDGAVVDFDFGTTDICVVVRTDAVTKRYLKHYRRDQMPSSDDGESAASNSSMRQVT